MTCLPPVRHPLLIMMTATRPAMCYDAFFSALYGSGQGCRKSHQYSVCSLTDPGVEAGYPQLLLDAIQSLVRAGPSLHPRPIFPQKGIITVDMAELNMRDRGRWFQKALLHGLAVKKFLGIIYQNCLQRRIFSFKPVKRRRQIRRDI